MRPRLPSLALLILLAAGMVAPAGSAAQGLTGEDLIEHQKQQLRRLGDVYYAGGSYYTAYEKYRRLVEMGAEDPLLYYRMGFAARHLSRHDEARGWFQKAAVEYQTRLDSGEAGLAGYYYLASVRSYLQDGVALKEVAVEGIERAGKGELGEIDTGPDLFRLSRLYSFAGRRQEAGEILDRAIEAYRKADSVPSDDLYFTTAMLGRARQLMSAGKYEAAADLYEQTVRLRPRAPGATYELGLARLRAGDLSGAAEAWGRARKTDSTRATEAGYAYHLTRRLLEYGKAYPDAEPVNVEKAYADLDRAGLEAEIGRLVGVMTEARKNLQEQAGPGGDLGSAAPAASLPAQVEMDRAEADLATALLAYHLRSLPTREVASAYRLIGWIFSEDTAG